MNFSYWRSSPCCGERLCKCVIEWKMHSDGDGWGWSGTAEEPASCYCGLIGPQAPSVRNNASLHGQVAAARRLPPLGDGRGELISRRSSLNETPRTQLHLRSRRHRHMKVCNPIFAGGVAFTFAHIKAARDMMPCVRCLRQPTQLSSGGP